MAVLGLARFVLPARQNDSGRAAYTAAPEGAGVAAASRPRFAAAPKGGSASKGIRRPAPQKGVSDSWAAYAHRTAPGATAGENARRAEECAKAAKAVEANIGMARYKLESLSPRLDAIGPQEQAWRERIVAKLHEEAQEGRAPTLSAQRGGPHKHHGQHKSAPDRPERRQREPRGPPERGRGGGGGDGRPHGRRDPGPQRAGGRLGGSRGLRDGQERPEAQQLGPVCDWYDATLDA